MHYYLLIIMTIIGSIAAIFFKRASAFNKLKDTIMDYNLYFGGALYLITALLNIYLLRYFDYSVVLPVTSLTYLWTMILSKFVFNESLTLRKIIGMSMIIAGVWAIV